MRRHHSIQISPGRFPSLDGAHARPGDPKPRLQTPRDTGSFSWSQEAAR
jgi:hypothetical protein